MSKTNARSKKFAYYATTTPGSFVEVSAHYTKGMNYFTYESYTGYKLAFTPVTDLKVSNGFCCSTSTLFSGLGLKVEPAERFNAKRLATIAANAESLPDYASALAAVAAKSGLTLTGEKLTEREVWTRAAAEAAPWKCLTCTREDKGTPPGACPSCLSERDANHGPRAAAVAS